MCGRFTLTNVNKSELSKRFNGVDVPSKLKAAYNIAPSQDIPVILNTSPKVISLVQWGLVSPWATDLKSAHRMNNARCETVTEKPSFKGPIKRSRCLVIADSFYEWQRKGARRQPFRILRDDESVFTMAGIWDTWKKGSKTLNTCTILTTSPNRLMRCIHHRMPVILPKEAEKKYLLSENMTEVLALLKPCDESLLKAYVVSDKVNSARNTDKNLIVPAELI